MRGVRAAHRGQLVDGVLRVLPGLVTSWAAGARSRRRGRPTGAGTTG